MKIAVLGSGPSLRHFPGNEGDYREIIGINRAVELVACSWWALHDAPIFPTITPVGTPKILTCAAMREQLGDQTPLMAEYEWHVVQRLPVEVPAALDWHFVTLTEAMVLAWHLGATRIDLWGVDWNGHQDWDGLEVAEARHPDRWNRERKVTSDLAAWLRERGVEVVRIGYESEPV